MLRNSIIKTSDVNCREYKNSDFIVIGEQNIWCFLFFFLSSNIDIKRYLKSSEFSLNFYFLAGQDRLTLSYLNKWFERSFWFVK